jgi:hypothetical protein
MSYAGARGLVCLLLGGIGVLAGVTYARFMHPSANALEAVSSAPRPELQLPSPRLSPDDVVRLQVGALRALRDDESAINQCYVLASPANRAYTGPLNRFIAMVQNHAYGSLVLQSSALVGQPVIRGSQATVLVTVLDQNRTPRVYRFFLSKQTEPPLADCWMTDAVIPVGEPMPERDRPPAPISAALNNRGLAPDG